MSSTPCRRTSTPATRIPAGRPGSRRGPDRRHRATRHRASDPSHRRPHGARRRRAGRPGRAPCRGIFARCGHAGPEGLMSPSAGEPSVGWLTKGSRDLLRIVPKPWLSVGSQRRSPYHPGPSGTWHPKPRCLSCGRKATACFGIHCPQPANASRRVGLDCLYHAQLESCGLGNEFPAAISTDTYGPEGS